MTAEGVTKRTRATSDPIASRPLRRDLRRVAAFTPLRIVTCAGPCAMPLRDFALGAAALLVSWHPRAHANVNVPGSPTASGDLWPVLEPTLRHVVQTLERD